MAKKNQRVLITGGSGFIGSHLAQLLLKKNHRVAVLDRSPKKVIKGVKVFRGDVTRQKDVEKAMRGVDLVYHLAGVLGTEELNTKAASATKINIGGAVNILDAALKNHTKVLLVSKPNVWLNTYSITKEASEKFCEMYQKEFGLKAAIVKWFSVYGPGQKHYGVQKAVPTFIVRALKNEPLPVFDDGSQMADFIFTSDTVLATMKVAESSKMEGKIVEIGTGKGTKIANLARLIIKLCQSRSKISWEKMRGGEDPHTKVVADTKLLSSLGFQPKVGLEDGLKATIAYYRQLLLL